MRNPQSRAALSLLSLAYLFFPVFGIAAAQVCSSECGQVAGNVGMMFRSSLLPMPNARLVFIEKNWTRYEARTDASGRYEIKLPRGTYWMEALKDGTCSIQRPDFRIFPAGALHFDFVLVACPSDADQPSPTYPYREQAIPGDRYLGRPEVRVASGERISTGSLDIYKSFVPQNSDVPFRVTLTVDKYTIRADELTLYRSSTTFAAEGNVEVSDGSKTEQAKTARLTFPDGVPKVEISH